LNHAEARFVCEFDAELPVDLGFVGGVCLAQDRRDAGHGFDQGVDLFGGHGAAAGEPS
jgi:hypothetical protein